MKKKPVLFFLILLAFCAKLHAQNSCLPGGIAFSSQEQIDSFLILYPDCQEIEGDVLIEGQDIENLDALTNIQKIHGTLVIGGDEWFGEGTSLVNFSGLENLDSIFGGCSVMNNHSLLDFSGLTSLKYIEGVDLFDLVIGFRVENNQSLLNFQGLENLRYIGVYFIVQKNNSLTSFSGLENLESVNLISIAKNPSLENVSGADNLKYVSSGLFISGNPVLENLDGFGSLLWISFKLSITGNESLQSISGLANIDSTSLNSLHIVSNSNLSICNIPPICDYLDQGDYIEIEENAPGCETQMEVETACQSASVDGVNEQSNIQLIPNPTTGQFQISGIGSGKGSYQVFHSTGTPIVSGYYTASDYIDLSGYPAGLYLVYFDSESGRSVKMVVKK